MEKLTNPPIIESQVGVRFNTPIDLSVLREMSSKLSMTYPNIKPKMRFQAQLNIDGKTPVPTSKTEQVGFQQISNDGNNIVLLETDYVAFCRVNKYPGWEEFKSSTSPGLNAIGDLIIQQRPSQFFSRYINSFKLPVPFTIEDYFQFIPKLPVTDPDVIINDLQYNFAITQNNSNIKAFVSFFPRPPTKITDPADFILDLSIVRHIDTVASIDELWENLEGARTFKNSIFLGLITDKLKARYK